MEAEPRGGFGRSIRGAEKAVTKLASDPATVNDSLVLQDHIEDFQLARKLQLSNLRLLQDRYKVIIEKFKGKPGFTFGDRMDKRFATHAVSRIGQTMCATGIDAVDAVTAFQISSCWSLPHVQGGYDQANPHLSLCSAMTIKDKIDLFRDKIVTGALVAAISESAHNRVLPFLTEGMKQLSALDEVELDTEEVVAKNDFLDVAGAVVGITGDVDGFVEHFNDIVAMLSEAGKPSGSTMMAAVARVMRRVQPYKEYVEMFELNKSAIENIIPKARTGFKRSR